MRSSVPSQLAAQLGYLLSGVDAGNMASDRVGMTIQLAIAVRRRTDVEPDDIARICDELRVQMHFFALPVLAWWRSCRRPRRSAERSVCAKRTSASRSAL